MLPCLCLFCWVSFEPLNLPQHNGMATSSREETWPPYKPWLMISWSLQGLQKDFQLWGVSSCWHFFNFLRANSISESIFFKCFNHKCLIVPLIYSIHKAQEVHIFPICCDSMHHKTQLFEEILNCEELQNLASLIRSSETFPFRQDLLQKSLA